MFKPQHFLLLSSCIAAMTVQAQEKAATDTLKEQHLQEAVVNSRLNLPLAHIATQRSTISRQEINFLQPQTAADLLTLSGNVFMQKSQMAGGSPMIRGLATNRLLYTVDGVRMNTAIFRAGNLQNVISLDPFATQDVEILFGPHSVLYGSDALGGVMSFNTLSPILSPNKKMVIHGNATLRYASANDEKTGHFDIRLGWKRFATVTSFSNFNFGNLRIGSHGPEAYLKPFVVEHDYRSADDKVVANPHPQVLDPTGYHQYNFMQKLLYAPNDYTRLTYAFHQSETSDYPRFDRLFVLSTKNDKQPNYAVNKYGPQKWMMNLLTVENRKANFFYDQVTLRLAHQRFEESRIDRKFKKKDQKTQIEKVNAFSANADFNKHIKDKATLFYGLEYVYDKVRSHAYTQDIESLKTKTTSPRYPNSHWQSAAAYVSADYQPIARMHLLAGVRYNRNDISMDFTDKKSDIDFPVKQKVHTQALTGNLGIDYAFNSNWSGRLSYSRGFRTPNVDDFGKTFKKDSKSIVLPNTNIHPEYASGFEAGTSGKIGKCITFDLAVYYTHLNDVIVTDDYSVNGLSTFDDLRIVAKQNGQSANLYGANLAAKWDIRKGLSFATHLNYQMGKEKLKDGTLNTMPHVAPFFGDARLQYENRLFRLQLYTLFQAKMSPSNMPVKLDENADNYLVNQDGKRYSPAWGTLNIQGLYHINRHMDVSMGINNLTDLRYRVYRSGVPSAGRSYVCSFTYHI